MVAPRYSFDGLASWCRAIRHGHGAGLPLVRVFEIQAGSGPIALRPVAARIARKLAAGTTLEDALAAEGPNLPELFTALAVVGERSGRVPEVFGQLEEYYRLQASMRREFRAQAAWPVFQFVAAVLVIALTIFLLGLLSANDSPTAPVGFGLTGTRGAVAFLLVVGSVVGGLFVAYKVVTSTVAKEAAFEAWLLRLPVLGSALHAAAMSRFCLALQLTLDSSMSIGRALRLSFRAAGNSAFGAQADRIVRRVEKGDEIARAMGTNAVFPVEFLGALSVAEVSGQIPEVMARQADHYREETARRMKALTRVLGWGVYILVGAFIIVAIFRMASVYIQALGG